MRQDIGWAIDKCRQGLRVRRAGWNGKEMWIALSGLEGPRKITSDKFWAPATQQYAAEQPDDAATVLPCLVMKTATGEILMGWLASQTDLLATDWELVDA